MAERGISPRRLSLPRCLQLLPLGQAKARSRSYRLTLGLRVRYWTPSSVVTCCLPRKLELGAELGLGSRLLSMHVGASIALRCPIHALSEAIVIMSLPQIILMRTQEKSTSWLGCPAGSRHTVWCLLWIVGVGLLSTAILWLEGQWVLFPSPSLQALRAFCTCEPCLSQAENRCH